MSEVSKTNTFMVQISYQRNGTWQGTVKWIEQRREEHFRSALELIRLIDDAVRSGATQVEAE